jgi:hypothetical protein
VESQKDFHVKRLAELGLLVTTTTTTTTQRTTQRTTTLRTTTSSTTTAATLTPIRFTIKERLQTPSPPEIVIRANECYLREVLCGLKRFSLCLQTFHRPKEFEQEFEVETNYVDPPDNNMPSEFFEQDNKEEEEEFYGVGVTTEMLEMEVTTLQPTTTTVETTTIPIRKCSAIFFARIFKLSALLFLRILCRPAATYCRDAIHSGRKESEGEFLGNSS